jgi:hypothetical protein
MDHNDAKNAIDSGNYSGLIGCLENETIEAKSEMYTPDEAGKQELSKDVCSFANRSGGIIIIGAKTQKDSSLRSDKISSLNPLAQDLIDPKAYYNVLKEWVFPKIEDIQVNWVPSPDDDSRGLVYIFIPAQREQMKPFLIKRDIDLLTNRKRKEILFGYIERVSQSSEPMSIENLQGLLRLGRQNFAIEALRSDLGSLQHAIRDGLGKLSPAEDPQVRSKSRLQSAIEAAALQNHRSYGIITSASGDTEVLDLFSSNEHSISRLMEHPPSLRYGGWNLETGDQPRIIAGTLRRAKSSEFNALELYRDGTLIYVCRADGALLSWGRSYGGKQINPLALLESTYMYFQFYEEVLKRFKRKVKALNVRVEFGNLHAEGFQTSLAPGPIDSVRQQAYRHPAPSDNWFRDLVVDAASFDSAKTTHEVVKEIYLWFGFEIEAIPYSDNENGKVLVTSLTNPEG